MKKNWHVVPRDGKWAVLSEGSERAAKIYDTQREAIEDARERAKRDQVELLIHGENGQIRERASYGNDPYPPKG